MTDIKELRQKGEKELKKSLGSARRERIELAGKWVTGSLKDGSIFKKKRKEIARVLTVLKEKEVLKEMADAGPDKDGEKAA